jgi:predicted MPP superfamily phosphohydrolase
VRRFAGPARHAERFGRTIRVAHLTDLHVGRVTPRRIHWQAVEVTNAARPDLVALTGDFVCHSQLYLADLEEIVAAFDAPVVAVLGNHDHWSGGCEVARALRRAGACVLSNAHTILEVGHDRLQIVGIDDAYTGHADLHRAARGLRRDLPSLALSHIAEEADALWATQVPLVLSGHTHGGQVTWARLHELALGRWVGHRYIHGLYGTRADVADRGAVYVGAGIGAAVMPFRAGDRGQREVTLFELGVRPGAVEEHHAEQVAHPGRPLKEETRSRRAAKVRQLAERRARANVQLNRRMR